MVYNFTKMGVNIIMAGADEDVIDAMEKKENMNPDFGEPELSDSDLERLENMKLDSIIEEVTSDDISVEELLNDKNTEADNEGVKSQEKEAANKEDKSEKSEEADVDVGEIQKKSIDDDFNNGSDPKGKKPKKKKKGLIAALKNIFFENIDEDVKASVEGVNSGEAANVQKDKKAKKAKKKADKSNEEKANLNDIDGEQEKPMDENQQLLDEMYGDKDKLDENIAPKKGLIAKIKYRLQQYKQKNEEEERLEEEAEIADQNERKKLKEEKALAKAAKKEEAKKAKEEKAKEEKPKKEKPKKEKKEKPKKEPKPGDILKIKPKSIIFFALFIAGVVVLITLFNSAYHYRQNVNDAKGYLEAGNYEKAYQKLAGLSIRKNDQQLLRQVSVIMFVQRQSESYNNYMTLDMKDQALNALVKGLERYNEYYREAGELGITTHLDAEKENILGYFKSTYNMSEADANKLVELKKEDFVSYYAALAKYRKAKQ